MDPDASLKRPGGFGCATRQSSAPGLIERVTLDASDRSASGDRCRCQRSPHGTHRAGLARPFASHPVRLSGLATRPDAEAVSRSPRSAHVHTAPTSSSPSPA